VVDFNSLSRRYTAEEWKEVQFSSAIHARIVFIDHSNKVVRVSMAKHIMEMRAPADLPELGIIPTE
jgi:hypothetical protein